MSRISTHVLDTGLGKPVHGMEITFYKIVNEQRIELASEHTDSNGRIENLDASNSIQESGTYCLHFSTEAYFLQNSISVFYPYV